MSTRVSLVCAASLLALAAGWTAHPAAAATLSSGLSFGAPITLAGADGDTEPRATVTPDGTRYVVTNKGGPAVVYASTDGQTWTQTASPLAAQTVGSIDTDIVSTHTGRLIAVELDFGGVNFRSSYSDDKGATWTPVNGPGGLPTPVTGTGIVDQDRPWLAVGPDDPTTHLPRIYVLMHNLVSGVAAHNMYVATSTDNGSSFNPFIPVTTPGTQAYTDLQCADSGGPSNLFTDPASGRVFAVFGTRSSAAGGCGASVTGSFEVNVVAATRVWIATADAASTETPGAWTQSLAVDDATAGQIVGMQLAPGAIDSADNLYVLYPESQNPYPDYSGAAIKYVHATESDLVNNPYGLSGPATQVWSSPVTVSPAGKPGNLLPHLVAGGAGQLDMAWFHGVTDASNHINWYATAAQTLNAADTSPTISAPVALASFPAYANVDASAMMGACSTMPPQSFANGFNCVRSTDVWGVAIDKAGNFLVTWPGDGGEFSGSHSGTFVSVQNAGSTIAPPGVSVAESPWTAALLLTGAAAVIVFGVRRRKA
jgi:hypothetical protein